jgi:hypothetical protein
MEKERREDGEENGEELRKERRGREIEFLQIFQV